MRHSWFPHLAEDGFQSAARGGSPYKAFHRWMRSMMMSRDQTAFRPAPAILVAGVMVSPRYVIVVMWVGLLASANRWSAYSMALTSPRRMSASGVEKPPGIGHTFPPQPQGHTYEGEGEVRANRCIGIEP